MKNIFLTTVIIAFLSACQSNNTNDKTISADGIHTAIVEEVIQTSQYTYLHVKEGNAEPWLALPKMQAAVGETYYYRGGLPMTNFESKELSRTFSEILFLDNISTDPTMPENSKVSSMNQVPPPEMEQMMVRSVKAEEVLQTSNYTYLRVKEGDKEEWLAVSKMDAAVGNTYYFVGGLPMTEFESKELKRTFKEILFLDRISTDPSGIEAAPAEAQQNQAVASTGSAIPIEKKEVEVKHAKEDITIAVLLQNKKDYSGKTIKMKGEVTKFSSGIMDKNWIHLQDGTDFSGKFDLTVTTDQEVKVGDKITVEGTITLDKDFGYGYFYEVMMENAKIIK